MKHYIRWAFVVITVFLIGSCSKERSLETGNGGVPIGGGNPGGTPQFYSWSLTGNGGAKYRGCIDTAYYSTTAGRKSLNIEGTDSVGNYFSVILLPASGTITAGTYKVSDGVVVIFEDNSGSYVSQPPASLTMQITTINDTMLVASFSGLLTDMSNPTATVQVSNGQMKLLIGKHNPCEQLNPGGGSTPAEFTLSGTGASCSNAAVTGTFVKGTALTSSNKVDIFVNVTQPGVWTVATTATNGMTFSNYGNFTGIGLQKITLYGIGTPTKEGANVIPITVGASSCSFNVRVDTAQVVVPGNGDYFPTTSNSKWVYNNLAPAGVDYEDSTLSAGTSITIGGLSYREFDNDVFGSVYRKEGGVYYRYGYIDYIGEIDTSDTEADIPFLKDNVARGTSWESAVGVGTDDKKPVQYKMKFTVAEKDVSRTVLGKTYNNVIIIKEELMLDRKDGAGYKVIAENTASYAKGIGLIRFTNSSYQYEKNLRRATIL
jgi:hypothetical protein